MPYEHPPLKTTAQLIERYGNPVLNQAKFEATWMMSYILPDSVHKAIPCLPAHIYMNRDIVVSVEITLDKLIETGLHREIKTWDGCFNVRQQRGSTSISRHSWGIALDINAAWNKLNGETNWTEDFLNVWREIGWICGADFHTRKDAMHFENTSINAW